MKIETFKSIILVFLIGLSFLLTLAIWNYEPTYDTADNDERIIEAKLDGKEETKKNIIQPANIIFYYDEDNISGLANKNKEVELYQRMQSWSLYDFEVGYGQFDQYQANHLEVIFPTKIPTGIIPDLFTIAEDSNIPDSSFDRVYIFLDKDRTDNQILFGNTENGFTLSANIQNAVEIIEKLDDYKKDNEFTSFIEYEDGNSIPIYLPTEVDLYQRYFSYQTISTLTLRNLLFNNPSTVRNSQSTDGQLYTDGTREMTVNQNHMTFTNPINSENIEEETDGTQLTNQILNFLNDHLAWTTDANSQFLLSDLNLQSNTIQYRLVYGGYPIFENNNLSTISVTWNNQNVYQYSRPLIQLKDPVGEQIKDVWTGQQVVSYLKNNKEYESKSILDIAIGYKISEQIGGQVFELSPAWFIKDYGGWKELKEEQPLSGGGGNSAVEPN